MYIGYDNFEGAKILRMGHGLSHWLLDSMPNLDCNVSVWMVPGTVDPMSSLLCSLASST